MLRFENVDLHYGSFLALDKVTLHANAGELVVLLGANGAGKTSIFMAASGIQKPSGGSIRFGSTNPVELVGQRTAQIVQSGLVHCPEGRKLFPMMSVKKNLQLGAYVHRSDKAGIQRSIDEVFSLFPILEKKQDDPAGSLSGGQQQMVAIGRAMLGRPKVLLLDEPMAGVPSGEREVVLRALDTLPPTLAILMIEHDMDLIFSFAHRILVLAEGAVLAEGTPAEIRRHPAVLSAYLGSEVA